MLRRGLPVEYSYSIKDSFYFKMCISFLFFFFKKLWWGKEGRQGPPPAWALISYCVSDNTSVVRLQNSPYFCVFKYARAVKQKVWNEAENRERDWGETGVWGLRASRAQDSFATLYRFLYWFWEKKQLFCSLISCLLFLKFFFFFLFWPLHIRVSKYIFFVAI